jgi:hypothetical protein
MKVRLVCVVAAGVLMLSLFPAQRIVKTTFAQVPYPEIPRISAYKVRSLFNEGKILLVCAQEENAQRRNMLVGAIGAPGGFINGSLIPIPKDIIVAFYCN